MSFIQVELDAYKRVGPAAGLAGIASQQLLGGLAYLWHWCWAEKLDRVTADQLAGLFGAPDPDRLIRALVAFGFLEIMGDRSIRVRGVSRYLRISEAKSEAGKASARRPRDTRGRLISVQQATNSAPAGHQQATNGGPALTPITDLPITEIPKEEEEAPAAPPPPPEPAEGGQEEPPAPRSTAPPRAVQAPENRYASGEAYFAWCQLERRAAGFVTEKPPGRDELEEWFSEVMLEFEGDGERLDATVAAFARDTYWRKRKLPFTALMKQWRDYAPRKAAS